jgi:MoaA/NifB/PqqE/SkfB family radical SAM enzyme
VNSSKSKPGLRAVDLLSAWKSILVGSTPMMSIEITRECPLSCPGCYAYGENHLGGDVTLRKLSDFHGDELVNRVLRLVRRHRPLHLSVVGGEPLIRHRELTRLLPLLGDIGVHTMVVTSAVIPVPREWMKIPKVRVAVSVDGLPEHHDIRRKPATYDRILQNISDCKVNIHWTITASMLRRPGYLEEYLSFREGREETVRIWASLYTPQQGEQSAEMLSPSERHEVAETLKTLQPRYPKLLMNSGIARAMEYPPASPKDCLFSKMSTNYSSDLKTLVEPCIFGGTPDCSQCGCAISSGLHWLKAIKVARTVKIETLVNGSVRVGSVLGKLRRELPAHSRWATHPMPDSELVQIGKQSPLQ